MIFSMMHSISSCTPDELNMSEEEYGHAVDLEHVFPVADAREHALRLVVKLRVHCTRLPPGTVKEVINLLGDEVAYELLGPRAAGPRYAEGALVVPRAMREEDIQEELTDAAGNIFRPNVGTVSAPPTYVDHDWNYVVTFPGSRNAGTSSVTYPEKYLIGV